MEYGVLQEVNVRELWAHEQYDFSNWIAKEKNIYMLNDILGLTLVDVNKEVYVGAYRCDIVARDEATNIKVIIENQLETSNHDHLGKIIAYASGLDATVIVWIVKEAREEHKSAIEWLNNNTNKEINFFLLEIHAYKIGDSLPAPKFEVIESPNGFIKNSKERNNLSELNKVQSERLNFWNKFNEVVAEQGKPFNIRHYNTNQWYNVAIGTSEACISINLPSKEKFIEINLYIYNNKEFFDRLYSVKQEIEKDLGFNLEWQRLDDKIASKIIYKVEGLDFDNNSNYNELMNEVIDKVIMMRKIFKKYI